LADSVTPCLLHFIAPIPSLIGLPRSIERIPRMDPKCPQAEWMAMSALRDSSNLVLDFEGTPEEDVSGITTPGEITDWLIATGC
jgi:hypothetical protein